MYALEFIKLFYILLVIQKVYKFNNTSIPESPKLKLPI